MANKKNRRLAAILFTDIAGFTAAMQEDERLAEERRNRHRQVLPEVSELEGKGEQIEVPKHNLPRQLSSFIGREKEIEEVKELLGQSYLVTLSGPGGTGKTRPALRVAESVADRFRDGICWVPLAPISDPALVGLTIGQTLGLIQAPDKTMEEVLTDFLRPRNMLLLLDNFEHVAAAAPLVQSLLTKCASIKILVTSRIVLSLPGEQEFPVSPLSLPRLNGRISVEELSTYPSVALFCQRARLVQPDFRLDEENALEVARICIRLDGLPLAIELAAARSKLFTPQNLLRRINEWLDVLKMKGPGVADRHQTLRQTIAWSYELLPEEERTLFVLLSVFIGGCSLEGAEAVSEAVDLGDLDFFDGIQALIDKSLLLREEVSSGELRYYMLETIRSFARELLESAPEVSRIKTAHASYFIRLGEDAQPHLTGPEQRHWIDVLEREHDNVRAAINWTIESGQPDLACRIGIHYFRLWANRGMTYEGIRQMNRLLALPHPAQDREQRLQLLQALGALYIQSSDYPDAHRVFREVMDISAASGNEEAIADAQRYYGFVRIMLGRFDEGAELTRQAMEVYVRRGKPSEAGLCRNNLVWGHILQGKPAEALPPVEKNIAVYHALNDWRRYGFALTIKAWALSYLGRFPEALSAVGEAISLHKENKDRILIHFGLQIQADIAFKMGDWKESARYIEEMEAVGKNPMAKWATSRAYMLEAELRLAERDYREAERLAAQSRIIWKECGVPFYSALSNLLCAEIARAAGDVPSAVQFALEGLRISREFDCPLVLAQAFEQAAGLYLDLQQPAEALRLIAKAGAMRASLKTPVPPKDAGRMREMVAAIASALDESGYVSLAEEGKTMALNNAVELAFRLVNFE